MAPSFSVANDEVLIELVATHPALWLMSHAYYKDQRVKDHIWAEVAEKVGQPLDQCKKRWRNIKDTYDRKKIKKTSPAAFPPKKGKKWGLQDKLSFLMTAEEHRGSFSNVTLSEGVDNPQIMVVDEQEHSVAQTSAVPTSPPTPLPSPTPTLSTISKSSAVPHSSKHPNHPPTLKRTHHRATIAETLEKRGAERNELMKALLVTETEDDVDLFFKSIAKSVKKLPMPLQQRAKTETLNLIINLETQMWNQMQYGSSNMFTQPFPLFNSCHEDQSSNQSSE